MIKRPIFIGGMPRSGTTLLRVMLDSHPNIACGPELRAIPSLAQFSAQTKAHCEDTLNESYRLPRVELNEIFRRFISSFLEPYARSRGKSRIAEKTPANVLHFDELRQLFPDCDRIHIIRDGRDVVASLLTMDWTDARTGKPMEMTRDPAAAAALWRDHVLAGRAAKMAGKSVIELRYEALARDPERTLRGVFESIGEPWDDRVLEFHRNATIRAGIDEASAPQVAKPLSRHAIGRWRSDLNDEAKRAVKREAGDLLVALGYASSNDW